MAGNISLQPNTTMISEVCACPGHRELAICCVLRAHRAPSRFEEPRLWGPGVLVNKAVRSAVSVPRGLSVGRELQSHFSNPCLAVSSPACIGRVALGVVTLMQTSVSF